LIIAAAAPETCGRAGVLPGQTQKDVLRAHIAVPQLRRRRSGQIQDLPGTPAQLFFLSHGCRLSPSDKLSEGIFEIIVAFSGGYDKIVSGDTANGGISPIL
jgi:hypothetical protein